MTKILTLGCLFLISLGMVSHLAMAEFTPEDGIDVEVWTGAELDALAPPPACSQGKTKVILEKYTQVSPGYSCPKYRALCVIDDNRCPKPAPVSPQFCPDGRIESQPAYLDVAGGLSCFLPKLYCIKDSLCPMPAPISPDYCKDGRVMVRVVGYFNMDAKHSCAQYEAVCYKESLCPRF